LAPADAVLGRTTNLKGDRERGDGDKRLVDAKERPIARDREIDCINFVI
jgi:hypothetical protein